MQNTRSRALRYAALGGAVLLLMAGLAACKPSEGGTSSQPGETTTTAATTTIATTVPTTQAPMPSAGWVNATTLHVRPDASTNGEAIGGLAMGDMVAIIGEEGDWYQIQFKPDQIGYVSKAYIVTDPLAVTSATTIGTGETAGTTDVTGAVTDATTTTTTATPTATPTATVAG